MNKLYACLFGLGLVACTPATSFKGESTVPNGPVTCQARCAAWGMELVGMVSMGENYTDGCICAVPGKGPVAMSLASGAIAGGTVGVELQRRAAEAQQQRQQQHYNPPR